MLEQGGYVVFRSFISEDLSDLLNFHIMNQDKKGKTHHSTNDWMTNNSSTLARTEFLDDFTAYKTTQVKNELGLDKLYPIYNYVRIYYNDSFCAPHIDGDDKEFAILINVGGTITDDYGVCLSRGSHLKNFTTQSVNDIEHKWDEIILNKGDAVLFYGGRTAHKRNSLICGEGEYMVSLVIYYNQNKLDKTESIGINYEL